VTRDDVRLTVVVATLGLARVERTVDDLLRSAADAGVAAEVLVVWQGQAPPAGLPGGVRVLDVFPVGLSYARNRGLAEATAPLVGFVDDDEAVDVGWVAAVLHAFDEHPYAAGVFGAVAPLDTDGIPYCEVSGEAARVFRRPSTPPWVVGTGGNMVFRRPLLSAIGGFDVALGAAAPGRAGEESDVIVRMLRGGHPLVWTPDAVVFHPTKTPAEHLASRRPYGHGAGAVARRRRDAGLTARYTASLGQSWLTGLRGRDRQRRREAVRTAAGFLGGLLGVERSESPRAVLARMPEHVAATIGGESIRPLPARYEPQPEFRYAAGPFTLRVLPGVDAVPAHGIAVVSTVERDALWLLEPRTGARR
jgi:hypothetical protein